MLKLKDLAAIVAVFAVAVVATSWAERLAGGV